MATVEVTQSNFEQTLTDNDIVLLDWWAEWCNPCKQFAPIYEAASEANSDIVFAKIDTEAEESLAQAAQITSIPMLMGFRDGIMVFAQPGALPAQALDEVISQIRNLDMTQVRAQYEEAMSRYAAEHGDENPGSPQA